MANSRFVKTRTKWRSNDSRWDSCLWSKDFRCNMVASDKSLSHHLFFSKYVRFLSKYVRLFYTQNIRRPMVRGWEQPRITHHRTPLVTCLLNFTYSRHAKVLELDIRCRNSDTILNPTFYKLQRCVNVSNTQLMQLGQKTLISTRPKQNYFQKWFAFVVQFSRACIRNDLFVALEMLRNSTKNWTSRVTPTLAWWEMYGVAREPMG